MKQKKVNAATFKASGPVNAIILLIPLEMASSLVMTNSSIWPER